MQANKGLGGGAEPTVQSVLCTFCFTVINLVIVLRSEVKFCTVNLFSLMPRVLKNGLGNRA